MDDRRFDLLVKSIGRSTSRRTLLRGMLGIAATAAGVTALRQDETDAARRGFFWPNLSDTASRLWSESNAMRHRLCRHGERSNELRRLREHLRYLDLDLHGR